MIDLKFSIGKYLAQFVDWLNVNYYAPFDMISHAMEKSVVHVEAVLLYPKPWWIIVVFGIVAWRFSGKGVALFTVLGLVFCFMMNLWKETMLTTALVVVSTLSALLIAIPFGMLAGRSKIVDQITRPIMDFMQTMPPWVYLIPAVILFGLGRSTAVMATAIYSIPPALRLTNLGIRQVPLEQVEAGNAFGASKFQILMKIQIPSALPTIMAGVNQCIMMALSMVVLAGLVGAGGLGGEVTRGLTRMMLGVGVRSGLAIVILAIIFDRISQGGVDFFRKGARRK
jgi:glycine betaine/proline transport system permease protein